MKQTKQNKSEDTSLGQYLEHRRMVNTHDTPWVVMMVLAFLFVGLLALTMALNHGLIPPIPHSTCIPDTILSELMR